MCDSFCNHQSKQLLLWTHKKKKTTNSQIGNGYKKLAGTFSLVSEPAKWNQHRKAIYTPSFVHTVPGTAETSETLGVGHFLLHCESSPALQWEKEKKNVTIIEDFLFSFFLPPKVETEIIVALYTLTCIQLVSLGKHLLVFFFGAEHYHTKKNFRV